MAKSNFTLMFVPSPTTRSALQGTNLYTRAVLLQAWLMRKIFVFCIYVYIYMYIYKPYAFCVRFVLDTLLGIYRYIYPWIPLLANAVGKLGDWNVVEETLRYLGLRWSKSICSCSFFRCMDLSDVVYIISTLKPANDLRSTNGMGFLVLTASFTF